MPERLTSQEIDSALRRADRSGRFTAIVSGLSLALITILFLVWIVFGQETINHQNKQILEGVTTQLNKALETQQDFIRQQSQGDRALICILKLAPTGSKGVPKNEQRTDKNTDNCTTAALAGYDDLQQWRQAGSPSS